jgi:hypothetical protein
VLAATYEMQSESNGTGPASRQLQDKVGGVAPAVLSPHRAARAATVGCGEYAMKDIADLLMRLWQGSQPASNTQVAAGIKNQDRSSMADFVRILQAYDQDQYGRS